jgi:hypothetical protein
MEFVMAYLAQSESRSQRRKVSWSRAPRSYKKKRKIRSEGCKAEGEGEGEGERQS